MSLGIVLWPDADTTRSIRELWGAIETDGVPSLATYSHRLHQPHVSLIVAQHMAAAEALKAIGTVPSGPIRCLANAAGVFPEAFSSWRACPASGSLTNSAEYSSQSGRFARTRGRTLNPTSGLPTSPLAGLSQKRRS